MSSIDRLTVFSELAASDRAPFYSFTAGTDVAVAWSVLAAFLAELIRGEGNLVLDGVVEQEGGMVIPKVAMSGGVIDVTKQRNDTTISADTEWSFSDPAPVGDTVICGVTVKATGDDREVTLPAGVLDAQTNAAVASFVALENKTYWVWFTKIDSLWYVSGYPTVDVFLALAQGPSYANEAAAIAGGKTFGQPYRTTDVVHLVVTP